MWRGAVEVFWDCSNADVAARFLSEPQISNQLEKADNQCTVLLVYYSSAFKQVLQENMHRAESRVNEVV